MAARRTNTSNWWTSPLSTTIWAEVKWQKWQGLRKFKRKEAVIMSKCKSRESNFHSMFLSYTWGRSMTEEQGIGSFSLTHSTSINIHVSQLGIATLFLSHTSIMLHFRPNSIPYNEVSIIQTVAKVSIHPCTWHFTRRLEVWLLDVFAHNRQLIPVWIRAGTHLLCYQRCFMNISSSSIL